MNSGTTHSQLREWLDLELDGAVGGADLGHLERRELRRHLDTCAECAAERAALLALRETLDEARVPVREGFRAAVMAALPQSGWEARPVSAWRLPAAMLLLLGVAAAALLVAGDLAGVGGSLLATLGSIGELLAATALAGAGLLGASWKGLGLLFSQALAGSPLHLAAAGIGVVCLDLLVLRMVRRRRRATAAARRTP
jgi:hypothetical protein